MGRLPRARLAARAELLPWQTLVILGKDDRLSIPREAARARTWLEEGNQILVSLRGNGTVLLEPFAPHGEEITRQLEDASTPDDVRLALQVRYVRLRVDTDYRVRVPKEVRFCLGTHPTEPTYIWLRITNSEVSLRRARPRDLIDAEEILAEAHLEQRP